jgi:hypothetical protein
MKMMKKLGKALRGGAVAVAPKKAAPMMAGAAAGAAASKQMQPALGGAAAAKVAQPMVAAAAKPAVGAPLQKKSIGKVLRRGLIGRR